MRTFDSVDSSCCEGEILSTPISVTMLRRSAFWGSKEAFSMEDPSSEAAANEDLSDDDQVAHAAYAAASALSESDAAAELQSHGVNAPQEDELPQGEQGQQLICRICGRGDEDGRPLLRFLPVEQDAVTPMAAPTAITFTEDIALHIFCGKTASILPTVNQPDLEILTKAGLKNKHGIGAEVNAALARTRCAILEQEGKEKHFFLVREFEAHLAAIRHTHISFLPETNDPFASIQQHDIPHQDEHNFYEGVPNLDYTVSSGDSPQSSLLQLSSPEPKITPIKATAGQKPKPGRRYSHEEVIPYNAEVTEDGKVRCQCGGTHLPTGTSKGVQSWRNHVMTKRHQKWMEENGMLGAV